MRKKKIYISFSDEPTTGGITSAVTLVILRCFSVYTMLSEVWPRMLIVGDGGSLLTSPNSPDGET